MTQTNTTQNKEELSKEVEKSLNSLRTTNSGAVVFQLHQYKHIEFMGGAKVEHLIPALKELFKNALSQAHQSGIEEERKRITKGLSDEMALFIKQWSYEQYGKRYLGNKALGYQRIEGVVIDLDQRINKVLKGESLKGNKQ